MKDDIIDINGIELGRSFDAILIDRLADSGLNVDNADDHTAIAETLQGYADNLARISVSEYEGNAYIGELDFEERRGIWKATGCYPLIVNPVVAESMVSVLRELIAAGHADVSVIIWPELSDDDLSPGDLAPDTVAEVFARMASR